MATSTVTNRNIADSSSATISVAGNTRFVAKLGYGDSMERTDVPGTRRQIRGRTKGTYKTDDVSLEMYLEDALELERDLAALPTANGSIYDGFFTITVEYLEGPIGTYHELVVCQLKSIKDIEIVAGDTKALAKSFGIQTLGIIRDGVLPFPEFKH